MEAAPPAPETAPGTSARGAELSDRRLLVIGGDDLCDAVASHIHAWGRPVRRMHGPSNRDVQVALADDADAVAVVSRDDIRALRYALLVEHTRPGIPLLVTIFDRTVADEVVRSVPNCTVIAMTDALVPALLGPCVAEDIVSLSRGTEGDAEGYVTVRNTASGPRVEHVPRAAVRCRRRVRDAIRAQLRPLEGTTRALLAGLLGLAAVFALDSALGAVVLGEPVVTAAWHAANTLTTVDSPAAAASAPAWYHALSTVTLLCVLAFSALFTAGLVDRMTSLRLTGMVGTRAVPRSGHVVVVGLGQVGLRLCQELQRLGLGVVAVERDRHAACLPLARSAGIPVVSGRGGDRFLLQRLGVPNAQAIVAVSSDPLENVAVAVAARAVAPDRRIVIRAGGEDDVVAESRSLFRIATVCDVNQIGGSFIAATALGQGPLTTFTADGRLYALLDDGTVRDTDRWRRAPAPDPAAR
ncbi:NAD-binding protein [Streptomonospora wellingtoniae]|uniref:NAD-binding protein n=1 Tax=Streptomonospora wellingtoniae TaxID=3075544 RepID=A0ABU2KYA9_9ACTN|nr:NAD-binding protein [Streptomonospora sp. DSM 45055]MDT0304299.1 NAD-binding protein [Streptomonospora sp. DSM 45055]